MDKNEPDMKLERCPSCRRFISIEANPCPKCGQPLEDGWAERIREEAKQKRRRGFRWVFRIFAFLFGGVALLIILAVAGAMIGTEDPTKQAGEKIAKKHEEEVKVTAQEFGEQWGFTVPELRVTCVNHKYPGDAIRPHVLIHANGKTYGLNGAAMGSGLYPSAREIMKKDKDGLYTFSGPTEVLNQGLKICNG